MRDLEEEIAQCIKKEFKPYRGWLFTGAFKNFSYGFQELSTDTILESIIDIQNKAEIRVLDIGCGMGDFVIALNKAVPSAKSKKSKIKAYGIAAPDDLTPKGNENILIKDAHDLTEISEFKSIEFDLIVANHVFMHLVHPKIALEKAYRKLQKNGIFICEALIFNGLGKSQYLDLFSYLKRVGHKLITFDLDMSEGFLFIIQKTENNPELKLPLCPAEIKSNKVHYTLSLEEDKLEKGKFAKTMGEVPIVLLESICKALGNFLLAYTTISSDMEPWQRKKLTISYVNQLIDLLPRIILTIAPLAEYSVEDIAKKINIDYRYFEKHHYSETKYCLEGFFNRFLFYEYGLGFDQIVNFLIMFVCRDYSFHFKFIELQKQLQLMHLPEISIGLDSYQSFKPFFAFDIFQQVEKIRQAIAASFTLGVQTHTAMEGNDYVFHFKELTAKNILRSLEIKDLKEPLVLDIKTDVERLQDAHYLAQIPELKSLKFNLIMARNIFKRFVHPQQVLEEAYCLLQEGGIFICDALEFKGLAMQQYEALFNYLKGQNYQLLSLRFDTGFLLIIKKTKDRPVLRLPLRVATVDEKACQVGYEVDFPAEFKDSIETNVPELYFNHYSLQVQDDLKGILPNFPLTHANTAIYLDKLVESLPLVISSIQKRLTSFFLEQVVGFLKFDRELYSQYCVDDPDSSLKTLFKLFFKKLELDNGNLPNPVQFMHCFIILVCRDYHFSKRFAEIQKQAASMKLPKLTEFDQKFDALQKTAFQTAVQEVSKTLLDRIRLIILGWQTYAPQLLLLPCNLLLKNLNGERLHKFLAEDKEFGDRNIFNTALRIEIARTILTEDKNFQDPSAEPLIVKSTEIIKNFGGIIKIWKINNEIVVTSENYFSLSR